MNRLDGEFIDIGDSVFDIINGSGSVIESTSAGITVRFGNNRKMTFTPGGEYNKTRRIFWHNPIILAPEKDGNEWQGLATAIAGLAVYIKSTKPPQV